MTYRPLSPKMSCTPSCTRSAKPGYFCCRSVGALSAPTARSFASPMKPGACVHHRIQRAIRSERASRLHVTHPVQDRCNTARDEPRSAASDQFSECAEKLVFGVCGFEQKMTKDTDDHQQLLYLVALREREERRVQRIWYFEAVRVLPHEEHTIIDQLADNESQYFPQITTGDQFL
jgi:hypothetical protein